MYKFIQFTLQWNQMMTFLHNYVCLTAFHSQTSKEFFGERVKENVIIVTFGNYAWNYAKISWATNLWSQFFKLLLSPWPSKETRLILIWHASQNCLVKSRMFRFRTFRTRQNDSCSSDPSWLSRICLCWLIPLLNCMPSVAILMSQTVRLVFHLWWHS